MRLLLAERIKGIDEPEGAMALANRCLVVPRLADCTTDVTIEALKVGGGV